jgi:hypothetical protein
MDKHKDLPEILQKVSDFFEGDLWERMGEEFARAYLSIDLRSR